MSTFDDPFDSDRELKRSGCVCGQHRSAAEHEHADAGAALRAGRERGETLRGRGRLRRGAGDVSQGRRAPRLPEIGRRVDRAGRDLAILPDQGGDRGVCGSRHAGEEGPQGRLHPDHLRDADHHGRAARLLCQIRPQRRSGEDRRLGRDPRQDHQQGIRRLAHAGADADRDLAGPRRAADPVRGAGDREHQRAGHHACHEAQGQARSEGLEGHEVRHSVRLFHAQLSAALLPRRARPRSRHRRAIALGAAAGNGRQPPRRQYRRLPRARQHLPARDL